MCGGDIGSYIYITYNIQFIMTALREWLRSLDRSCVLYIHAFSVKLLVYVRAMDKNEADRKYHSKTNRKKKNKQTNQTDYKPDCVL